MKEQKKVTRKRKGEIDNEDEEEENGKKKQEGQKRLKVRETEATQGMETEKEKEQGNNKGKGREVEVALPTIVDPQILAAIMTVLKDKGIVAKDGVVQGQGQDFEYEDENGAGPSSRPFKKPRLE